MPAFDLLMHLLNFLAPAAFVALSMVVAGRLAAGKTTPSLRCWMQAAINFAVGALALLLGLWLFGRDGKMATYAALVVFAGTSQWLMGRGWRAGG